jgi:anti-sigma B factor antagonist
VDVEASEALVGGPGWARLSLAGDIDLNTAAQYRPLIQQMIEQRPQMAVVDLSAVTFMDSSGLGLVAALARACGESSSVVYVADASDIVRSTLEACGLDQYVVVVNSDDPRLAFLTA